MNKTEIDHLDSINPFYEKGDYMDRLMIDREIEIIGRYASAKKSAVEIGCGDGFCTERLYKLFPELEVVEPSGKNIQLLKNRLPDIVCNQVLLEDFQPAKKYDFVFFLNVIEHVQDPIESLKFISQFLADDGLVFITAPNCMSLNRRAGLKMGLLKSYDTFAKKDIEVGHRRLYTTEMMKDHCQQGDLRLLDMKGIYLKPLAETQMMALGEDAIRAFCQLGEDVPQYCASLMAIATKKYY